MSQIIHPLNSLRLLLSLIFGLPLKPIQTGFLTSNFAANTRVYGNIPEEFDFLSRIMPNGPVLSNFASNNNVSAKEPQRLLIFFY